MYYTTDHPPYACINVIIMFKQIEWSKLSMKSTELIKNMELKGFQNEKDDIILSTRYNNIS